MSEAQKTQVGDDAHYYSRECCPSCLGPTTLEIEAEAVGAYCEPCHRFRCGYCSVWFDARETGATDSIACDGCWVKFWDALENILRGVGAP